MKKSRLVGNISSYIMIAFAKKMYPKFILCEYQTLFTPDLATYIRYNRSVKI